MIDQDLRIINSHRRKLEMEVAGGVVRAKLLLKVIPGRFSRKVF